MIGVTPQKFWASRRPEGQPAWVQVEATERFSGDQVSLFVDDKLWGDQVDEESLKALGKKLNDVLIPMQRGLFGKDEQPVTVLLGEHRNDNGGYVNLGDFLSETEAQQLGGHSNGRPVLYLNATQSQKPLDEVAAHELQHLFAFQHDRDDSRWLYEFMAQSATLLAGYDAGSNDYEVKTLGRPGRPFVTLDDQQANYPGLTRFAQFVIGRYGAEFISALNAETSNGIESFDKALQSLDQEATFESTFRDYMVEFHRDKERFAQSFPFPRTSPADYSEVTVLGEHDLFHADLSPTAAYLARIDHEKEIQLTATGMEPGSFLELLTPDGRQNLELKDGKVLVPAGKNRTLMIGSAANPAQVQLRLATDGDPKVEARFEDSSSIRYPFGHTKLHVTVGPIPPLDPEQLAAEHAQLEQVIARAEGRKIYQPLDPVPEAAAEALKILHRVLQSAEDQELFRTFLGESGDPKTALGLVELLRGQPRQLQEDIVPTFLETTRYSRKAGHYFNASRYSQLDGDGRYFANLVLFHSLMQPGESWAEYHPQVGHLWNASFEVGAEGGSLGTRRAFKAIATARDPGEPLQQAADRAKDFVEKLQAPKGSAIKMIEAMPAMAAHRPQGDYAQLAQEVLTLGGEFPEIHREILPDLLVEAYGETRDLAGLRAKLAEYREIYSDKTDPVTSHQVRQRFQRELKAGRWPAEAGDAILAELEREVQLGQVLGVPAEELIDRAFNKVRARFQPEKVAPNIEIDEGGIWIGETWVPIQD